MILHTLKIREWLWENISVFQSSVSSSDVHTLHTLLCMISSTLTDLTLIYIWITPKPVIYRIDIFSEFRAYIANFLPNISFQISNKHV